MGEKFMHTPNLDKLAAESLVFNRAFCQQAICGPTRNSFLTSRRPQRTKVWNFIDNFREEGVGADWVSFPQYFKEHGYTTLATGKTFHVRLKLASRCSLTSSNDPLTPICCLNPPARLAPELRHAEVLG